MSKSAKQQKQTAVQASLDDIIQMIQRKELHVVVNEQGRIGGGRFDGEPLSPSYTRSIETHQAELIDLVKHNDLRVCIEPANPVHTESYQPDKQGRMYCHACQTYRETSDYMHKIGKLYPEQADAQISITKTHNIHASKNDSHWKRSDWTSRT